MCKTRPDARARFIFAVALTIAAAAVAGLETGCFVHPVELPNPEVTVKAASYPIEAITSDSLAALKYPYLELPGEPSTSQTLESLIPLEPKPLSLSEAVLLVFQNDLNIQVSEISHKIKAEQVEEAKSIFDTVLTAGASTQHDFVRKFVEMKDGEKKVDTRTQTDNYSAGLSQLLPTGGTVSIDATEKRSSSDPASATNPEYDQSAKITLTQPLLKGFGPGVTLAGIRIAILDKKAAYQDWRKTLMDQVTLVMTRYWDLVFAVNKARVTNMSMYQAQALLDINRKKVEVGLLPTIDVLQAEAQVAARRDQLFQDINSINDTQDSLKTLLRLRPDDEMWKYTLLPTEIPGAKEMEVNVEECLRDAYAKRPEIEKTRMTADSLAQTELVKRNATYPSLDAFYSYGLRGVGDSVDDASDDLEDRNDRTWRAGVEFSYPLQNRKARAQLRETRERIDQTKLQWQQQLEAIAQGVRVAARDVQTSLKRIETTRAQTEFELAKVNAQIKRYENGIATSKDVLDAQNDLAAGRRDYLSALVAYNQSVVSLDRARGTILERNNIMVAEKEEK